MTKDKKFIDITGMKFSRLLVISCAGQIGKNRSYYWHVLCDCGCKKVVNGSVLRTGQTKSCGCLQSDKAKAVGDRTRTHGMTNTSTYAIWDSMHQRCSNPKRKDFSKYGGRGISVCTEWDKFDDFLADMGERPKGLSLDRIDNDLGYSKSNCRWATAIQQGRNQRTNHMITFNGETRCIAEWAEFIGVNKNTLYARLTTYQWPVEKAMTKEIGYSNGR